MTFDTTTLRYQGERDGARIWLTAEDDGLGLFFFPLAPDINANLRFLDSVRSFYCSATASVGRVRPSSTSTPRGPSSP